MTPDLPAILSAAFPGLASDAAEVLRLADPRFNCVAWAAGLSDAIWWPSDPDAYWPPEAPDELSVAAMVAALNTVGYTLCTGSGLETGHEKVAIYARDSAPTHVARQLRDGRWSSKLGRDCLVAHATPGGVEGAVYGSVAVYLRRPVAANA